MQPEKRCVKDPRLEISDACKNCNCANGIFTSADDTWVQFYTEALKNRGVNLEKNEIERHLEVLFANMSLYSRQTQLEYGIHHKAFEGFEDYNSLNRKQFENFTDGLPTGTILVIGALYDRYDASDKHSIISLDLPINNDADELIDVKADGILLPFSEGQFSGVFLSHVAHHLYDPILLYREAVRVTKEGGRIFSCGDPNRKLPPVRKFTRLHKGYRAIYWGLRYFFDIYLKITYPPREIGSSQYYADEVTSLAEFHDMGVHVERGFDARKLGLGLSSLNVSSVKITHSWDSPKKLPVLHKFFLATFLILGFGKESCYENINVEIMK